MKVECLNERMRRWSNHWIYSSSNSGSNSSWILEFAFRNISLDKHCLAYSTDSGINKLPKGILRLASGAEV